MVSEVYFVDVNNDDSIKKIAEKVRAIFRKAELDKCIGRNDLTAIKMHFGEKGNDTHIQAGWVRPVADEIKKEGGKPFLTDTCVLYKSERDNAVDHLHIAHEHGFTMENVGAPVVIADGLMGNIEKEVEIPGKIYKKVSLASVAVEANAVIGLAHVTGHLATGIGGAIKNLGMGFASRKGKLQQHSVMRPSISRKACTGCEVCIQWCPEDAISMEGEIARIDSKQCIGCGECLTVCRFGAVKFDWGMKEKDLQERMAEHALGVVVGREEKAGYMNFLMSVTKDCDCFNIKQKPIFPDIGILAGKDPVAIDAASLNLIQQRTGKSLNDATYPNVDPWIQVRHGEDIGLGTIEYKLIEV
jgi:uncharacterized Fe-S center protein